MSQFYLETPGGGTPVVQFDCPDGGNTVPDSSGLITITESAGIDITCSVANEINFAFDITEIGTIPDTFAGDSGTAQPSGNQLTIAGGTGITTSASGSTVTVDLDVPVSVPNGGTGATSLTDGGILLGSGTSAVTVTAQPTNGQLLIGSTGVDPVLATLTEGTGIDITNGAGSITVAVDITEIGSVATTYNADSGSATPAANAITFAGGAGITTSATGSTVTIALDGGGTAIDQFTTDVSGPVSPDGTGAVDVTGTSVFSDGSVANTLTLNVQATANTFLIGAGAGSTATEVGPLTNGQLLIGSTSSAPVAASLTAPAAGISITGGAGSVTFALADDLAALEGLSGTGVVSRTAADTYALRTITGTAGEVDVTNGDGVSGNPTISIPDEFINSAANTHNLGMTLSGSTITIHGYDGTALSASNPAFLRMPSTTAGQSKIYTLTANYNTLNTEMNGNLMGTTTGRAWANAMPFFVYFMIDDSETTPIPAFCRLPHMESAPAAANIGDPSAANADEQFSMYAWDDITEADYNGNPVVLVGSARATKSSGDVWTYETFNNAGNGIDLYDEGLVFGYAQGHNGNDASSYFVAGAGTVPSFSNQEYGYKLSLDGHVELYCTLNADGGTDGSGAVAVSMGIPFNCDNGGQTSSAYIRSLTASLVQSASGPPAGTSIASFPHITSSDPDQLNIFTNADFMQYQDFTNGARRIYLWGQYLAKRA